MSTSPTVRWWAKIDRAGPVPAAAPDLGPCWLWTGKVKPDGYAQFTVARRPVYVHRFGWTLLRGPLDPGIQLDHLCRVRHCVNPDHLEAVTCRENLMRGDTLAAVNAAKTHCASGHAYDEANTYTRPDGARGCRACGRERQRRYRERFRVTAAGARSAA